MQRSTYTTPEPNVNYTRQEVAGAVAISVGAVAAVIVAAMAPGATAVAAIAAVAAAAVRRAGLVAGQSPGPPDEADARSASETVVAD